MMRRGTRLAAAIIAAAAAGLGAPGSSAQTFTMKVACNSIGDVQAEWVKLFAERVEARSGGRIKASAYPGGQLGTTPRVIEGVQFGSIEAYIVPAENFVGLDQRFQVVGAPGWFDNMQHAKRTVLDQRLREEYFKLGEPKGLKGVSFVLYGPISYASRQPIRNVADFRGKKIRVAASKLQEVPLQKLGASTAPIPLGEVLPALQQGTVDAVRLSINLFNNFKYYDVVKNVTMTEEAVFVSVGVLSRLWFDKLPKDLQTVLVEEGAKLNAELTDWSIKSFEGAEEVWTRNKGEIIRFPAEERARFLAITSGGAEEVFQERAEVKRMHDRLREIASTNR